MGEKPEKTISWQMRTKGLSIKVRATHTNNTTKIEFEGDGHNQSFVIVGKWDRKKITRVFALLVETGELNKARYVFEDLLKANHIADA